MKFQVARLYGKHQRHVASINGTSVVAGILLYPLTALPNPVYQIVVKLLINLVITKQERLISS